MCTDMNTCTQPLTRVICLCMLCAVSESVELLSRAHPLNVVLYIELSCMSVCASPLCLHVLWPPTYSMCAHMHCVLCPYIHVYSCRCVCIQGLCQTHCVGMVLTSVYCVWLVCLFRRVYDACLMCTLYSPCVCTVSVQLCTVHLPCVYCV